MTIRRAIPTCRFAERPVALGAEIRPDRPAQAGRQRFAPDSPVEGVGFEPSVPGVPSGKHFADSCQQAIRLSYSRTLRGC
jgi:hypothetical protein